MTVPFQTLFASAVGLALISCVPAAHAQCADDATESKAFLAAGMTVAKAAAAAEGDSGGTAMSVAWEPQDSGAAAFVVELAKPDGTVTSVVVDPKTGAVAAAPADTGSDAAEADDDNGAADNEDDDCETTAN